MVEFPSALPPVGGPSFGAQVSDQVARAEQDAQDIGTGFDQLHDRLGQLREEPALVDDGSFIGQFVGDLTYTKSTLVKVMQDQSEGKISDDESHALVGDGKNGGIVDGFYEICHTPVAGLRLGDVMETLDPPPMTDAAHYCQGLTTQGVSGSRGWLEETMLPRLKEMSEQLHNYKG